MNTFKEMFTESLNEGKKGKPTKTEMKKLGSMLKKTYNTSKVVSFNYVEADKSSYIVYELEQHTLVLQKKGSMGRSGDKGGVSMGVFANKKPSDIDFSNAWTFLGTSDNIYAYQQSGVGGRELLNPAIEAFASDILGAKMNTFTESTIVEGWSGNNTWQNLEKRAYNIEVRIKEDGWEIWVGIKNSNNTYPVSQDMMSLLNSTSDNWYQEPKGYIIEGTTVKQLKDTLKVLKAKPLPKAFYASL